MNTSTKITKSWFFQYLLPLALVSLVLGILLGRYVFPNSPLSDVDETSSVISEVKSGQESVVYSIGYDLRGEVVEVLNNGIVLAPLGVAVTDKNTYTVVVDDQTKIYRMVDAEPLMEELTGLEVGDQVTVSQQKLNNVLSTITIQIN